MRCSGALLGISALACAIAGCGEAPVLSVEETKHLLRQLPYRYEFREVPTPDGANAAVAGRAFGRHHARFNFGIALGHGSKPVVLRLNPAEIEYHQSFVFTDDSFIKGPGGHLASNPRFHTAAQWHEAISMIVAMTDKLCLATTGEHCPAL